MAAHLHRNLNFIHFTLISTGRKISYIDQWFLSL